MYAVRVKPTAGLSRDTLMSHFQTKYGIQTRTFFYSPKTAFKKLGLYQRTHVPVTKHLEKTGLYLPSGLGNTSDEFISVSNILKQICTKNSI
jgi:dTDP-4-amino-4,6-dideoxygalactose transaminase